MEVSSMDTMALDPEADAQVAALEKEMEEITGEVPDNGAHTTVGSGNVDTEETQILGDLNVEDSHQFHHQSTQEIKKEEDKFSLEGEDGDVVYYVVENDAGEAMIMQSHPNAMEEDSSEAETQEMDEFGDDGEKNDTSVVVVADLPGQGNSSAVMNSDETKLADRERDRIAAALNKLGTQIAKKVPVGDPKGKPLARSNDIANRVFRIPSTEPGSSQQALFNSISSNDGKLQAGDTSPTSEPQPIWDQPACIICNASMRIDDPDNLIMGNVELKGFYAKMLGINEGLQVDQEMTYAFCEACSSEVAQLRAIGNKIDFMHRQFEKIRDSLAKKTVRTFLERKAPELLEEEKKTDGLQMPSLKDTIYNRWKTRYDLTFPGPRCPVLIKTMDAKGRTTVIRMSQQEGKETLKNFPLSRAHSRVSKEITRRVPVIKVEDDGFDKHDITLDGIRGENKSGELPFECEVCGKGFAVPHYLMIHMRSHTGEKPYKCEVCGKGFAQRGGLVTHNLVHSGDKPFDCNQCGKSFRQKYHLTQHLLIHSGDKPFGCEVCGKFFNVKMNLREHMRRHTGDRPYKCPYCLVIGFFRKKMLRDHIIKTHPAKPLPGELENLSESKPPISRRRPSTEEDNNESAKRIRKRPKVKLESSSEDYLSRSPSPNADGDTSSIKIDNIPEEQYTNENANDELGEEQEGVAVAVTICG